MSNDNESKVYEQKRYFAIALDPIYVGTGGYRIGRVDNTIVREPATGIPKIPGTTIEGVCRSYAYLKAKENRENVDLACAKGKPRSGTEQPCGECKICITFGFSRKDKSHQAMALFSDVRILFFPVATMIGPVWITCGMVLKDAGIKESDNDSEKEIPWPNINTFIIPENCKIKSQKGKLNFGWLLLSQDYNNKRTNINNWIYYENDGKEKKKLKDSKISEEMLNRIVIVPDDLFATIINSNLEVRTSVAIDPERGAAEEGALFTYEAIPRGTVFWFDITFQNPTYFPSIPKKIQVKNEEKNVDISLLTETVTNGLKLLEYLGVGGMSSRGFGRLRISNLRGGDND